MIQGKKCGSVLAIDLSTSLGAIALILSNSLSAIAAIKNLDTNPVELIAQQQNFSPGQQQAFSQAKQLFTEAGKLQPTFRTSKCIISLFKNYS
jgi:hypothetical protein